MNGLNPSYVGPAWVEEEAPLPSKLARLETAFWVFFIHFVVVGYYIGGKSFAYVGVPKAKVFIGEIFLVLFVLAWPRGFFETWLTALVRRHPLSVLAWAHLAFLAYGLFETLRGIESGYPPFVAVQNLVFNVYPVYMFIGYWFARKSPGILERLVWTIALVNGVYGVAFIGYLNRLTDLQIPGSPQVAVFGQPIGTMVSMLGLIIIGKRNFGNYLLLLMNGLVILGTQVRSDWLGFLLGLLVWGILTRNLGRVFQGVAVLVAILGVGLVADVRLPGVAGRGGETSAREIVGRALAGIDKEAAREFSKDVDAYAGTLSWRKNWWKEIWTRVHQDFTTTMLGLGYGFPLATLVTYIGGEVVATRTPHNIFYYALGYSGWIGVLLFVTLHLSVAVTVWRVYRQANFSLAVAVFVCTLTAAFWGNLLEAPFGAIPFFTLVGMFAAKISEVGERTSGAEEEGIPWLEPRGSGSVQPLPTYPLPEASSEGLPARALPRRSPLEN